MRLTPMLLFAVLLAGAGCSEPYTGVRRVTGLVTLDGAALAGADVEFQPEAPGAVQQGAFGGRTDAAGRFTIELGPNTGKNAQAGRFVVLVTKGAGIGAPLPPEAKDEDRVKQLMKMGPAVGKGTLPGIYANRDLTPFKAELKEGVNEVGPFDLKGKKK